MTGTPVMNKLVDFYNLINVLSQGTMLKMSQHKFIKEYMKPIENGRKKNAPAFAVHRANTLSKVIRDKTDFWILRRTKKEVNQASTASSGSGSTFPTLPAKNDFVLWCKMTARQLVIYNDFLTSESVRNALMAKSSPLVQCTLLNMICNCPRIMPNYLVGDTHNNDSDLKNFDCVPLEELLAESGKLLILAHLLDALIPAKILIFSNSKKILTIIEKLLSGKNIKYDRIDGTIQPKERNNKVHRFQTDSTIKVCLLTTGVGAVGLTLTAATRVIVFDPYWNPSKDDQAVDRAYRIGQKNAVVVFRLITCETIEEKIYSKQLFKKSIICQNNGENDDPTRLFNDKDIYELFKSPVSKAENMFSETQKKLLVVAKKRKIYPELERILGELDKLKEFHAGIHDHDLAFDAPDVVKRDLSERQKQNLRNIAIAKGARKDIKIYHVEKIVNCLPSLFKNIEIGQKLCNSIEKNKKRSYPFADAQILKVEDLTPPTKRISSSVFVDEELGVAMKAFKITDSDYELKFFS
ncbi:unnamed protein product [Oikopleura dioica]|uniref:Helicase C-terminal domain-containing protein n=1 Tax=Oikopleura dioica TaxID=34765 RepID=E4XWV3_OIKDI|nr:unnamed protein product [Oikopleura dioica]